MRILNVVCWVGFIVLAALLLGTILHATLWVMAILVVAGVLGYAGLAWRRTQGTKS